MENTQQVIDWTLRNKDFLDLQVIYYEGLIKYFNSIFDIGITIRFKNEIYKGRGTDKNEKTAYLKAFSECIERVACSHYKLNSTNGLAAHTIFEEAKINARNELIERDAFMCHYLLMSKLKPLSLQISGVNSFSGINIKLYEMYRSTLGVGVLALAYGASKVPRFGLISGTSFQNNEAGAVKHALIEVARNLDDIIESHTVNDISLEDFNNLNNYSFNNHGELSRNLAYAQLFENSLNSNLLEIKLDYLKTDFRYEEIDITFIKKNLPLKLARAHNFKLQNIFSGPTIHEKINLQRLSQISGKKITFDKVNPLPHPFD